MKRTKIFFMNGIILTITAIIMKSISMLFGLYVSNKINSEALGVFNLVMSVYLFAITLATSGLNLACTYLVSEQFEKGNFLDGLKAVKSCLIFSLLLSLSSSLIVFIFSDTISHNWLKSMISGIPLYLVAIGLPFISISSVLNGYFSAKRKAYKSAISQVLELLVKIFSSIILLNLNDLRNVEAVCICLILADVISEIFSCFLLYIFYKIDKYKISKYTITKFTFKKRILKITFPVSITSYIRSALSTLKQFIIPSRLVLYGLPYSIALSEYGKVDGITMSVILFPNVFISSFSGLLIPEFASLKTKNYKKRILEISKKVIFTTSIFSIVISFIMYLYANNISLCIFKNLECARYIKMLSPLILFMYLDNIIDSMLKGLNKQSEVMLCNILDLSITICALYFLLPNFGLLGYLLSILLSETFNFAISYFQLYRAIGIKMSFLILICCIFAVCLTYLEINKIL